MNPDTVAVNTAQRFASNLITRRATVVAEDKLVRYQRNCLSDIVRRKALS
jgi:hypothetical protein